MIVSNPNFRQKNFPNLRGLGGLGLADPRVNATTMWLPGGGGFLATTGDASTSQQNNDIKKLLDSGQLSLKGKPACSSDSNPFVSSSSECIAQLLANQQNDFAVNNAKNYSIDLTNCLNTFPQPTDCYQRTYGLTPVGGFTGGVNVVTPNAQQIITGVAPIQTPPNKQTPTTQTTQQSNAGAGGGGVIDLTNVGSSIEDTLMNEVDILGHGVPVWALGLAAVGVIAVAASSGRH